MIKDVYIIRSGDSLYKFLEIDPDTGNWDWTSDLESATIFQTPVAAENIITQKLNKEKAYVYQIPYSILQPQVRKKKKIIQKTKRKPIKKRKK